MNRLFYRAVFCFAVCFSQAACSRCESTTEKAVETDKTPPPSGPLVTCPVCGLTFHQSEAVGSASIHGKTYYFYLKDHMKVFKEKPEPFLDEKLKAEPAER